MDIFDGYEKISSHEKFAPIMSMEENKVDDTEQNNTDIFDQVDTAVKKQYADKEESWPKWFLRSALQIPKGIAQAKTWGADLFNAVAYGAAVDPSEVYDLQRAHERAGLPFNEEEYLQAAGKIAQNFPTVGNLSRMAEEKTGIPLEAKTRGQKFLEFASTAGTLAPKGSAIRPFNTSLPKPILGAAVAGTAELGKELGVPEPIADLASFAILKTPTTGAGKIEIGSKKKPSGLKERQFEDLKTSKNVKESTVKDINETVEKEFRDITENIIEKTPLKETRNSLKAESDFKSNVSNQFEKVHELATKMPGKIVPQDILNNIRKEFSKSRPKGYALSEYETELLKHTADIPRGIFKDKISTVNLVDQYRKNNKAFSQLTEPGKSFAYNQAKRDALQVHNKAIANAIEQMHPNSEMANLFKETNEQWSKIMDSESIDSFLDELFKGKIQFKKGRDFLNKSGVKEKFNKALGKEGTAQFETLVNDLMSYEQGLKFLKQAKHNGWKDIATTSLAYMWHPGLGKAKLAYSLLKNGYKTIYEAFLKSPKIGITWDRAVNAAKAGNFKAAEAGFKKVDEVIKTIHPDEIKGPPKSTPRTDETINAKGYKVNQLSPDEIIKERAARNSSPKKIGVDIEAKGSVRPESKKIPNIFDKPYEVIEREQIGMTPRLGRDIDVKGTIIPERKLLERKSVKPSEVMVRQEIGMTPRLAMDIEAKGRTARKELSNTTKSIPLSQRKALEKTEKKQREARNNKSPVQTPSVIEMALAPYLKEKPKLKRATKEDIKHLMGEKKKKAISKLKEGTPKSQKDYVEHLNQREQALEQLTWEEAKNIFKEQNPGLTEKGLSLLKIKHENRLKDAAKRIEIEAVKTKENAHVDSPKKIEQKIKGDIKRQDISSAGLAAQKDYLLSHIDKALANVGNNSKKIIFDVPGDGIFKILDTPKALESFKKGVEKNWPKKSTPYKGSETYKLKPIGKPSKKADIKKKADKIAEEGRKLQDELTRYLEKYYRERHKSETFLEWVEAALKQKNINSKIIQLYNEMKNMINMFENLQELYKTSAD